MYDTIFFFFLLLLFAPNGRIEQLHSSQHLVMDFNWVVPYIPQERKKEKGEKGFNLVSGRPRVEQ